MTRRKQTMPFRDAMALVDDDMPDGAFWAMAHEFAGLEYGDGFDELAEETEPEGIHEVARRKPFKCLPCRRRFAARKDLEAHVHATGHAFVECPACSKRFGDAAALQQHIEMKHPQPGVEK